jgi:hypothetical protein
LGPRRAEWVAALSGLGLLLISGLAWYDAADGSSLSAWQAFNVTDVVIALAGATALVFGVAGIARPSAAFSVPASSVIAGIGFVAAALVVIRLLSPPDDLSVEPGAWLGLLACLAITAAGWRAMGEDPESASSD